MIFIDGDRTEESNRIGRTGPAECNPRYRLFTTHEFLTTTSGRTGIPNILRLHIRLDSGFDLSRSILSIMGNGRVGTSSQRDLVVRQSKLQKHVHDV